MRGLKHHWISEKESKEHFCLHFLCFNVDNVLIGLNSYCLETKIGGEICQALNGRRGTKSDGLLFVVRVMGRPVSHISG